MADAIRKPWLLSYLVSYAEQHGGQLLSTQLQKGKVQIINFRTLPESPDQWVWADVSDKQHAVPVRFTMESVKAFNNDPRNAGRRLTSRRWGVAIIRCMRPLWCRPPAEAGTGLEEKWTLALEVDYIEIAASEGEAMFGAPRCVTREEIMQRWIEGLRDSHGPGGNVLKLERLERERKERERNIAPKQDKDPATNQHPIDAIFKVEPHFPRANEKVKDINGHQRIRNWTKMMKKNGLMQAYESRKLPDTQVQLLEEITVFGLDSSTSDIPSIENQHLGETSHLEQVAGSPGIPMGTEVPSKMTLQPPRSPPRNQIAEDPTTPSQWTTSQKTYLGDSHDEGEDADVSKVESLLPQVDCQPRGEDLEDQLDEHSVQRGISFGQQGSDILEMDELAKAKLAAFPQDNEDEMQVDESLDSQHPQSQILSSSPVRSTKATSMSSTQSQCPVPPPRAAHRPVILAPDSDVSGSQFLTQSQTQSLTQPSISQFSISSQQKHHNFALAKLPPQDLSREFSPTRRSPTFSELFTANIVHGRNGQDNLENSELESDDEAARKIMTYNTANSAGQNIIQDTKLPSRRQVLVATDTALQEPPPHKHAMQGIPRVLTPAQVNGSRSSSLGPRSLGDAEVRGTKRNSESITTSGKFKSPEEPAFKRRRRDPSEEVLVQHVEHNVDTWRGPSFARLKTKTTGRRTEPARETPRHRSNKQASIGGRFKDLPVVSSTEHPQGDQTSSSYFTEDASHAQADDRFRQRKRETSIIPPSVDASMNQCPPEGGDHSDSRARSSKPKDIDVLSHRRHNSPADTTRSVEASSQKHGKLMKLGGWRPRNDVTSEAPIMTWEKFNRMLLKVGQARESNAQRARSL